MLVIPIMVQPCTILIGFKTRGYLASVMQTNVLYANLSGNLETGIESYQNFFVSKILV